MGSGSIIDLRMKKKGKLEICIGFGIVVDEGLLEFVWVNLLLQLTPQIPLQYQLLLPAVQLRLELFDPSLGFWKHIKKRIRI